MREYFHKSSNRHSNSNSNSNSNSYSYSSIYSAIDNNMIIMMIRTFIVI